MKYVLRVLLLASFALSTLSFAQQKEVRIPRSVSGDKGKYYLLSQEKKGDIVNTLHKRVGVDAIGYTRSEINCKTMKMRVMGYSEESPKAIRNDPTQWFDLEPGSSKSDLVNFVCSRQKKATSAASYGATSSKPDAKKQDSVTAQNTSNQSSGGGRGYITFFALILIGIAIYKISSQIKKARLKKEEEYMNYVDEVFCKVWQRDAQLIQPNWTERDWTGHENDAIAMDKGNGILGILKFRVMNPSDIKRTIIPYDNIIRSEVVVDSETIMQTQTNRGSQVVGAVVGGVLAGGVGAIIGGVTGSKTHLSRDNVTSVELKLLTTDGIVNIPFGPTNLRLATKWHDLLTIAMHGSEIN